MKTLSKTTFITSLIFMSLSSVVSAHETPKADMVNGAQVWSEVCMRCHNLRGPEDLNKRAWEYSMNHMRIRAGLTGQETRDVLKFILMSKTTSDAH